MDYQNGKIYTIRSPHTELYYIGSTASTLTKRLSGHKSLSNTCKTSKIIIDYGDAYIELLELFPCNSKIELRKREGELQRLYINDIVNIRLECRTRQEYYQTNNEKINLNRREYQQANAEKLKLNQLQREYRQANCEKLKLQRQKYRLENAGKINLKQKQYRQAKKLQKTT